MTFNYTEKWAKNYALKVAQGDKSGADNLREDWKKAYLTYTKSPSIEMANSEWMSVFQPLDSMVDLPRLSFFIQFEFHLSRSYISKDDNNFYIIDNPIVRDKVFKWPLVRPTTWKGSLRSALWQSGHQEEDEQIKRLFGEANETEDTGKAGRLYFYPTFFSESSLEIINPHDREKRIGKNPILIECVPIGAIGTFTLLYVPLDRIGENEDDTRDQVAEDLRLVAEGLQAMFTVYGFGAKTSSGFGVAQESMVGQGQLQIKADISLPITTEPAPTPPPPDLPRYLSAPNQLHPDFQAEEGGLIAEAEYRKLIKGRGKKYTKRDEQLYAKAKGWWEREGQVLAEAEMVESEPPPPVETPLEKWPPQLFNSFSALVDLADEVAEALTQGEST